MKKMLLLTVFALALFAVPMIAQEEPKKVEPKEEPKADEAEKVDPKVKAEADAWNQIQELQKGYEDTTKPRAERIEFFNKMNSAYLKYIEEQWVVNIDNTKKAVSFILNNYASHRQYENFTKLADKVIKEEAFEAYYKDFMHILKAEIVCISQKKYEDAIKEVSDVKIKEGEMTIEELKNAVRVTSMLARANFGLGKKAEAEKYVKQHTEVLAKLKDEDALRSVRYFVMKLKEYTVVVGKTAPNWKEVDFEGKSVELKDFKGKYVLLDFWATWCGPCRSAMESHLKPMHAKYKEIADKFVIVSVGSGSRDTLEKQKEYAKKMGYNWNFVFDGDSSALQMYGVSGIPTLILVDPEGKILFRGHGNIAKEVENFLDEKFKIGEKEEPKVEPKEGETKDDPKKEAPKTEDF